jgi:hypothetical protein
MTDKLKKLEQLQKISLSKEEKLRGREHLVEYIGMKPAREKVRAESPQTVWTWERISITAVGYRAVAALLVVIVSGGVVIASEQSLPGDMLYSVKTTVNEGVREVLATTPESKARVQAELLERRVVEAEQLALRDRLSGDNQRILETKIAQHAEGARKQLERMEQSSRRTADDSLLEIEGLLRAHEARIAHKTGTGIAMRDSESVSMMTLPQNSETGSASIMSDTEAQSRTATPPSDFQDSEEGLSVFATDTPQSIFDRLSRLEQSVSDVKTLFRENRSGLSNTARYLVDDSIREAEEYYTRAQNDFFNGDFAAASRRSRQAVIKAQEARTMIRMRSLLIRDTQSSIIQPTVPEEENSGLVQGSSTTTIQIQIDPSIEVLPEDGEVGAEVSGSIDVLPPQAAEARIRAEFQQGIKKLPRL